MTRDFRADPVEDRQIDQLAGWFFRGPRAGNTDALDLVVLTGADSRQYWDVTLPDARRQRFPWPGLLDAPTLLLPYVRPAAYVDRYAESDKAHTGLGESADAWQVPYWWVDGGAAVENVLLGAAALDLGACFFGQFDNESALRSTFGVPSDRRALGTIAVGTPAGSGRPSTSLTRKTRSVVERVHRERWGSSG